MSVFDNSDHNRFELVENGLMAFAEYRRHDTRYTITHVEADPQLRGTGAAGRLMEQIVEEARTQSWVIVPRCTYAVAWFKRHPDASDVLD